MTSVSLQADVAVIGSGGAGLCAAAAAVRAGARTILLTKGKAGLANCTAYAGGGFTVSPPPALLPVPPAAGGSAAATGRPGPAARPLTPDEHFHLSLETGRYLSDRELLAELCRRGPGALEELERDFGVRIDWHEYGCSVARYGRPPVLGGAGLTGPLVVHLRKAGARLVEGAVVTTIVRQDGEVRGVLAVLPWGAGGSAPRAVGGGPGATPGDTPATVRDDETAILAVSAPAVVVATGGGGAIYGRTDNPPRTTGDGYLLLAEAGAILEDMEFVQFYPLGVAERGLPSNLIDASLLDLVRLTDETGADPLAGKYASGTEVNLRARDKATVALARHIAGGHRTYLHLEELDPAGLPRGTLEFIRGFFPRSFDPFARPVEVAPTQHYFCGGAVINASGEVLGRDKTPLGGLFACGETTGGVDGANRVGGNALTNVVVFGLAAGEAAARYAARARTGTGVVTGRWVGPEAGRLTAAPAAGIPAGPAWRDALEELTGRLSRLLAAAPAKAGAVRPADLRRELNTLGDTYLGPVRSAARLKEVLERLAGLERRLEDLRAASPADLLVALELRPAVATATFVARAALARTESRGAHFREDYPSEDPAWLKHVTL